MKQIVTLRQPLEVNGTKRKELSYDIEKITGDQFIEADARAHSKATQIGKVSLNVAETDTSFQLYLGFMAVIAENPDIDITDLERINGCDIMKFYRIGRNFTKGSVGEEDEEENLDSEESSLDEPTEVTPEPSTRTSKN